MAKSPQEVVFEGWLTKSPPTKRIWRARWRRRWFLLTHSGELPGQYILTYYTDRNCRKLKGVIHLDQCEQVDLGLKLDERKLKFDHVFDIKTPTRTYYLAADTDNEMRSWVTYICKVCSLKPTNEDDALSVGLEGFCPSTQLQTTCPEVEITEEYCDRVKVMDHFNQTPPVTPISSSPYIPISECITGKSPVFNTEDLKKLLNYSKNDYFNKDQGAYYNDEEFISRDYLNCKNVQETVKFYDCPRKLAPQCPQLYIDKVESCSEKHGSPLQSPTDSDSVFTDEYWCHNTPYELDTSKSKKSESSDEDGNFTVTKKFTKANAPNDNILRQPPPRPPKPTHISTSIPCSSTTVKEPEVVPQQKVLTDDMYDFPRSHHVETETTTMKKRHCYNNAAPSQCPEGIIFRYDISPKAETSTAVFQYEIEDQEEPPSPAHSHSSSAPTYSNLPSPSLSVNQTMLPPTVNRELKPKRKSSDSHSVASNPEPSSPRNVPSVDRKLKPPTPLQEAHMRKPFHSEEEQRKHRAAPSPTPTPLNIHRSHDSLLSQNDDEQMYHYLSGKMQYLDLDLDGANSSFSGTSTVPTTKSQEDTVYKKVDFMKTEAFNLTRNILEKERQVKK
ncbi:GRB2-associated-binding protein 1 [Diorhabda sublineata]|uniref:GRB2-associated-binding protein 1 n=1 Tax=Diorhabda sublineata TaxID=1163346 RepID=UPI0024E059F0|nr:GRB2-associated-binding protein 1 [Diorhabda sublineata]